GTTPRIDMPPEGKSNAPFPRPDAFSPAGRLPDNQIPTRRRGFGRPTARGASGPGVSVRGGCCRRPHPWSPVPRWPWPTGPPGGGETFTPEEKDMAISRGNDRARETVAPGVHAVRFARPDLREQLEEDGDGCPLLRELRDDVLEILEEG